MLAIKLLNTTVQLSLPSKHVGLTTTLSQVRPDKWRLLWEAAAAFFRSAAQVPRCKSSPASAKVSDEQIRVNGQRATGKYSLDSPNASVHDVNGSALALTAKANKERPAAESSWTPGAIQMQDHEHVCATDQQPHDPSHTVAHDDSQAHIDSSIDGIRRGDASEVHKMDNPATPSE
ncbi:MAG: hypothetical protein Q9166_004981 [cf. Caloplaca sp. 2 TL-2023]